MGREATISYDQVAAIADSIKASGIKPTLRSIREKLGNVGSMGTINRHLQEWKAGQERKITGALVLPPALQNAMLDFMERELAGAKSVLEADLAEQRQEAADLATENERQAVDIEDKVETLAELHAELATLHGRLSQIESDLSATKEDADRERKATEVARIELAKALLRLEAMPRLESDLYAVRDELDKERHNRVEAEQKAAVLIAKLEATMDRAVKAEAATLQAVQEVIPGLESNLTGVRDELDKERHSRVEAEQNAAVLAAKLEANIDRTVKAETATQQAIQKVIPGLESELSAIRDELNKERQNRIMAEQQASKSEDIAKNAAQDAKLARDEAAELRGKHAKPQ